jgi:IclR family acetate operon transcriptional repressor
MKTIELSRKVAGQNRIAQESRSMLAELNDRFRESVYLGIYRQERVVMIDMIESPQPVRVVVDLGEQCYLHASSLGRCVAAYLEEDTLRGILKRTGTPKLTRNTKVTCAELRSVLTETRKRGYAINREETVEGAVCVAAPFFSGTGAVLGAAAVSIPVSRATDVLISKVGQVLREATSRLSRQLEGITAEPSTLPRVTEM